MDPIEYIGLLAAGIGTFAYFPQVLKTLRSGSASDFSLTMLIMLQSTSVLWFVYGLFRHAVAIAVGNGIILVLASIIVAVKVREMIAVQKAAGID